MAYSENFKRFILAILKETSSAEKVIEWLGIYRLKDLNKIIDRAKLYNMVLSENDLDDLRSGSLTAKTIRDWLSKKNKGNKSPPTKPLPHQNVSQVDRHTESASEKPTEETYESFAIVGKAEPSNKTQSTPQSSHITKSARMFRRDLVRHYNDLRQFSRRIIDEIYLPQLGNFYVKITNKPGTYEQLGGDPEIIVFAWSIDKDEKIRILFPSEIDANKAHFMSDLRSHLLDPEFSDVSIIMGKRSLKGGEVLQKWHDLVNIIADEMYGFMGDEDENARFPDFKLDDENELGGHFQDALYVSESAIRTSCENKFVSYSVEVPLRFRKNVMPTHFRNMEHFEKRNKQFKGMIEFYSKPHFTEELANLMNDWEILDNSLTRELVKFAKRIRLPGDCQTCIGAGV